MSNCFILGYFYLLKGIFYQHEMHICSKFDCQPFSGNESLRRRSFSWARRTNEDLAILASNNPYSSQQISTARETIAKLREENLDINFLFDQDLTVRSPKQSLRRRIVSAILAGKVKTRKGAEELISPIAFLRKWDIERIETATVADKQRIAEGESTKQERIKKVLDSDQETVPLKNVRTVLIKVHHELNGKNDTGGLTADLKPTSIIEVLYSDHPPDDEQTQNSRVELIRDRDGGIPQNKFPPIFHEENPLSVVVTGGNLRGCLSNNVSCIASAFSRSQAPTIDIHLPLDQIYDNNANDGNPHSWFPDERLTNPNTSYHSKVQRLIFYDGKLIDAVGETSDKCLRLFYWSSTDQMKQEIL